jgi:hypothetical protein
VVVVVAAAFCLYLVFRVGFGPVGSRVQWLSAAGAWSPVNA